MAEKKAYVQARKTYEMALETDKQVDVIYKKMGFMSLHAGNLQQAKKDFEEALLLSPDNEEIKDALRGLN